MNGFVKAADTKAQAVKPTAYQTTTFWSFGLDCVEKYVNKPPRHCACVALKESKEKWNQMHSQIFHFNRYKNIEKQQDRKKNSKCNQLLSQYLDTISTADNKKLRPNNLCK